MQLERILWPTSLLSVTSIVSLSLLLLYAQDEGHGGEKAGEKTEGAQRPPPGWTACMAGEAIDLSLYSRLMALLATTNDLNPHLRSLGWVITRMDELYDAR